MAAHSLSNATGPLNIIVFLDDNVGLIILGQLLCFAKPIFTTSSQDLFWLDTKLGRVICILLKQYNTSLTRGIARRIPLGDCYSTAFRIWEDLPRSDKANYT